MAAKARAKKATKKTATKKKTAFVTGGSGFIGLNLIDELLRRGWRVTALHRPSSDLKYLKKRKAKRVAGDISDADSLRRAMPKNLDAVFHVAGNVNTWSGGNDAQDRDNIDGTRNMVAVALEKGARKFVHTSTVSVYGLQKGTIAEDAPRLGRVSWINYQRSKFLAEQEVLAGVAKGLDAVMLNPTNVVGAYDSTTWAGIIRMVTGGGLRAVPPGANSFCHVGEVVKAHIAAVERGRTGENYLLGGVDASYRDMIRIVGELAGRAVPARPTAAWKLRLAARLAERKARRSGSRPPITPELARLMTRRLFVDCSKAESQLGYKSVPLRVMLEESYDWLKKEGLLGG